MGEVGYQPYGLLQQEEALVVGIQPVCTGAGQVEDSAPASQGAVQQVQDGPGVVGQVDLACLWQD